MSWWIDRRSTKCWACSISFQPSRCNKLCYHKRLC